MINQLFISNKLGKGFGYKITIFFYLCPHLHQEPNFAKIVRDNFLISVRVYLKENVGLF